MSRTILTGFDDDICSRCGKHITGRSAVLLIGGETLKHEPTEDYPDPVLHTMEWEEQHLICIPCTKEILDDF